MLFATDRDLACYRSPDAASPWLQSTYACYVSIDGSGTPTLPQYMSTDCFRPVIVTVLLRCTGLKVRL